MTEETIDLLVVTTGGSIDAHLEYEDDSSDRTFAPCKEVLNRETNIPKVIESLGLELRVEYKPICMKNSDEITDTDRSAMYEAILESSAEFVVITHGLNTLAETQRYLHKQPGNIGKTVVLVGAKRPETYAVKSDTQFQLGFAIASAQTARHGIYRVDNGRLLDTQDRRYDHDQFRNATG